MKDRYQFICDGSASFLRSIYRAVVHFVTADLSFGPRLFGPASVDAAVSLARRFSSPCCNELLIVILFVLQLLIVFTASGAMTYYCPGNNP